MFDLIVFRGIRGIVSNANLDLEFVDQPLQILLKQVLPRTITTSTIAE
jgi:hypothetical protein